MSDTVIRVENLSKKYIIGHQKQERYNTLRDAVAAGTKSLKRQLLMPVGQRIAEPACEEFWALKDVSFEIKKGDRVGIIGRNGAGKSTLLKILSRIVEPTTGRISIKGRVASLLEVGTGFHPELTGRENIYLNGAILGMSKAEIKKKFDEIVTFAEIEKFLDTPVKRYSSGMYVRLAFAVAAHLEPEILVVDEVLAVGDAQFQKKCLGKMEDVSGEGRTVLFVSHSMPIITSLCQKSILLEAGCISKIGFTSDVLMHYYTSGKYSPAAVNFFHKKIGDEYATLISASIQDAKNCINSEFLINQSLKIKMLYKVFNNSFFNFVPNFHFYTADGTCAFVSSTIEPKKLPTGERIAECHIPANFLNEGAYFVGLALSSFESGVKIHFYEQNALSFNVKDPLEGSVSRNGYAGPIPGVVRPQLKWSVTQAQ